MTWDDIETADLTDQGWRQAYMAGRMLAALADVGRILTSPVLRCVHTAEEIGRGYQDGRGGVVPVVTLPVLHYDVRTWNAPGVPQVVLEDNALAALFAQSDQAEARLLAFELLRQVGCDGQDQLVVAISHDTVITLVAGVLLGTSGLTVADSPGFLQGVAIQPTSAGSPLPYRLVPD
jgi:broad specificity phosphatase PhoE